MHEGNQHPQYRYDKSLIQPWDKRVDETAESFVAFAFYRDCGPTRSLRGAWFLLNPQATTMNATFFKWSRKNKWKERCNAFDLWCQRIEEQKIKDWKESKSLELERNRNQQRVNEVTLGYKAMAKADEILSLPLIRRSFTSQQGGVLEVHKTFLMSPAHLIAATALMKHGSDMARRGLSMTDEEIGGITTGNLKEMLYKTTQRLAEDMPAGALPVAPADAPQAKQISAEVAAAAMETHRFAAEKARP